jgi:hypothetical protein
MPEPTFDVAGYPTEETLQLIKEWSYKDFPALMQFVATAWKWNGFEIKPSLIEPLFDRGYEDDGCWWCGATGGWSGNESLIGALMENSLFWLFCWRASVSGGYYEFHVKPSENA